jgi:hypothetical protein
VTDCRQIRDTSCGGTGTNRRTDRSSRTSIVAKIGHIDYAGGTVFFGYSNIKCCVDPAAARDNRHQLSDRNVRRRTFPLVRTVSDLPIVVCQLYLLIEPQRLFDVCASSQFRWLFPFSSRHAHFIPFRLGKSISDDRDGVDERLRRG